MRFGVKLRERLLKPKQSDQKTEQKLPGQANRWHLRKGFIVLLLGLPVLGLILTQIWIATAYQERIFTDSEAIPARTVALLLGTAKTFQGRPNLYYLYRIRAAAALYQAGKVRGILVSGDNSQANYDEPSEMRTDLIQAGVPAAAITLDYAGFRTLDSVVRAEKIFGQQDYIVVSQPFHIQRALFLGDFKGHQALGFVAEDVPIKSGGLAVHLREVLARSKALLDLLSFKSPHFLGPPETLNLPPN